MRSVPVAHSLVWAKLLIILASAILLSTILSISGQVQAGGWKCVNSCCSANIYGEGQAAKAAADDLACALNAGASGCGFVPNSSGLRTGFYCSGYHRNVSCQAHPTDLFVCTGFSSLYCNAPNESMNSMEGYCVKLKNQRNPENCKKQTLIGDPVDIATGTNVGTKLDWHSGGYHPLELVRYYASDYKTVLAPSYSRLGPAWRTNFDARASYLRGSSSLTVITPGSAIAGDHFHFMLPDSIEYSFVLDSGVWKPVLPKAGSSSNIIYWTSAGGAKYRKDIDVALSVGATDVDLRLPTGVHYDFDSTGLLQTITYPDGYQQILYYAGSLNTKIVDSLGRQIVFQYSADPALSGFLQTATMDDGSKIAYSYTSRQVQSLPAGVTVNGLYALSTVTYPDTTPANDTDNPKITYEYVDNADFPFALADIVDERGVKVSAWTYYADGRVASEESAGGQEHVDFSYDDVNNKVTVTNPLGRQTVYSLTVTSSGNKQISQIDGVATVNCAASNTIYAYDANGSRSQATDAEGRVTTWINNTRGRPTSTTEGSGTASARTTALTWDATRPLVTQVVAPNLTTNIAYNSAGNVTQFQQIDTTTTSLPYSTNGQTRTTTFGYTPFTAPAPPVVGPSGTPLSDIALTVANSNAEAGTTAGWTNVNSTSPLQVVSGTPCVSKCFWGGGSTVTSPVLPTIAYQDVAIPSANVAEVDAGQRAAKLDWNQFNKTSLGKHDPNTVRLIFLNAAGTALSTITPAIQPYLTWTPRSVTTPIPVGTRTVRIQMLYPTHVTYNTDLGYVDDIALTLIANGTASAQPFLSLTNSDALSGSTTGWTAVAGVVSAISVSPCGNFPCFRDSNSQAGGNDEISQDAIIPSDRYTEVDNLARSVEVKWINQSGAAGYSSGVAFDFLDAAGAIISGASSSSPLLVSNPSNDLGVDQVWTPNVWSADVPAGTRKIRLRLKLDHTQGQEVSTGGSFVTGLTLRLTGRAQPIGSVNLLTSVDGPLAGTGDTTTYAYDTHGNLASVTDPMGHVTQITAVDAAGRPATIQDMNGVATNLAYDPRGHLTSVTVNPGASQAVTTIDYDAAEQVSKVTAPDGSFLQYTWDDARRLTIVTNNTG